MVARFTFMNKKHSHSLKEKIHFITRFLAQPHSVGSVWPSSRYLAKVMLQDVPLKAGDVVVEYGPGTGPFTSLLRSHVAQGVEYLGIERDYKLYKGLKRRFPEMRLHHGSAEETPTLLQQYGLKPASLIVSGLPFANMPPALQQRILEASHEALDDNGIFRTFTYLFSSISPRSLHFQKLITNYLQKKEHDKMVLLNFPPAWVMSFTHR